MGSVRRVTEQLERPDLDDRSYRVIELPNKLEALLVHDGEADQASASLAVNVGSYSDEKDMPGMAHAVEHLLFMGTEKYPVENEYSAYLAANSGNSNAYTSGTHTNYFFECAASNESDAPGQSHTNGGDSVNGHVNGTTNGTTRGPFWGALDRFAQFFVQPLFLEDTLDRELRAVDSENKKNLQNDVWRLSQLQKSLSNPQHPFNNFSTGNLETLRDGPVKRGVKIRNKFIEFYDKHYSANRMKLVVLGRETLDDLESWVVELFSDVINKDLPLNRWDDIPLLSKHELNMQTFAKPIMGLRSLDFSFPWEDEEELYQTQPSRYISHLIGHEGPGSILAYLKDKGLANDLSSGAHTICPGSALFELRIGLTPQGLKNYQEVAKVVFQYISMMKENPPLEWIHNETIEIAKVDFKFKQKSPASRFTSTISARMQQPLPREWLLSGTGMHRKFDAKSIVNAMQYLREDNFRMTLISQDIPGDWDRKEPWYGTDYKIEQIPTDLQAEIRQAIRSTSQDRPAGLHLPGKNEFIPTQLEVEKIDVNDTAKSPKLIRNDDYMRLWWKKDDTFWVPKANISILLRNSTSYASPANYVKTVLYINLVKDALAEYSYDAEVAGLGYGIGAGKHGLDISVSGYNDKMAVLLEKIMVTLRDLDIKDDRFEIIKERLDLRWKNWEFQQPYYQVGDYARNLINEKSYMAPVCLEQLSHITLEDLRVFKPSLISQAHMEVLAHGNLYKEDVKKIGNMLEATLKPRPLSQSEWSLSRNILIPEGSNFLFEQKMSDPDNVNHVIEYILQLGHVADRKLRSVTQLFAQITEEPAFDQLRTKEQLGYVVWSGARVASVTLGYRVLVQSEREPSYLESRVEAFLTKIQEVLENMTLDDFEGHKRSLIIRKLEKYKNLNSESNRLWDYITREYYNFFQVEEDVADIRKLTPADVKEFYEHYINPKSLKRAKLSVHLLAGKISEHEETDNNQQTTAVHEADSLIQAIPVQNIEDVHTWKAGLKISEAPRPVIDIHTLEDNTSKL